MNPDPEKTETEFVLPIICPHCSQEINLGMMFGLLPPTEAKSEDKIGIDMQGENDDLPPPEDDDDESEEEA